MNAPPEESSKPTLQRVELAKLRDEEGTRRDGTLVTRYAEEMLRGDPFPPIDAVAAGDGTYCIIDGCHRVAATRLNAAADGTIEAFVYMCPAGMDVRAFMEWLEVALAPAEWLESFADDATAR